VHRQQLLPEEWDYQLWKEQHLARWLSRRKQHCLDAVYMLCAPLRTLLEAFDWDYAHFLSKELDEYLKMTQEFMDEETKNGTCM